MSTSLTSATSRQRRSRFGDLSVRTRIIIALGVLVLVLVGTVAVALQGLRSTLEDTEAVADVGNTALRLNAEIDHGAQEAWRLTYQYDIVTGAARAAVVSQMDATDALLETKIAEYDTMLGTMAEPNWETFKTAWSEWTAYRDSTLMPAVEDKAVTPEIQSRNDALIAAHVSALSAAGDAANAYAASVSDEAAAHAQKTVLTMIVLGLAGLVIALVVALVVANGIRRSAEKVRRSLVALAEGDLTVHPDVDSRDEIGQMAVALATAQTSLRAIISTVAGTAQEVAGAADRLSYAGAQFSASSEETAAQSGVVAAAAEQVSQNVRTVAA
ncbi:HAMP domain-containing protein, partial [Oerskovia sp. NPDC057915]|uniref:HAMP domain-containing protein n=1 Tax=Oerskovia sp. NPDC057915 TaxID=3346280 RepID=UPI0036D9D3C0